MRKNKINEYNFVTKDVEELESLTFDILNKMFGVQNSFNHEALTKLHDINTENVEHFNINITEDLDIASGYLNEAVGKSIINTGGLELHIADYRSEIYISSEHPVVKGKLTCNTDYSRVTTFELIKSQFNKSNPFVSLRCRYKNDEVTNKSIIHSVAVQIYVPKSINVLKRIKHILKFAA